MEAAKAAGNAAFKAGNFEEAVKHFTDAIASSTDEQTHVLYSNRSGAYASLEKWSLALEDATSCIKHKPEWAKGYSRKGLPLFRLGRLSEAVEAYETGLKIDPENAALKSGLKECQEFEGSRISAMRRKAWTDMLKCEPKFAAYAEEDNDFIPSVVGKALMIATDPAALQTSLMLADTRTKEALAFILNIKMPTEESQEEEEESRRQSQEKKRKKEEETRQRKEEQEKKDSLTPEQKDGEKFKLEANALYKARKFDEALVMYDKALAVCPDEISLNTNKAAVYLEMGQFDKCIAECESVLERRYQLKTDYSVVAKVYCRMGACYQRQGDYVKACLMYEKALVEDNSRQTRLQLKAAQVKKQEQLKVEYLDPKLSEEHREKGNTLFKAGDFPGAKSEYDESIKRNPSNPIPYSNRAAALTKLLEYPSALKDCETALDIDPKFIKCWSRKGTIHFFMKEYNKSLQAYQKGLAIEPENKECREGVDKVMYKIQESTSGSKPDEDQVRHAMADPEIQEILMDPQFRLVIDNINNDPSELAKAMKDPKIASGIKKLMAAGILRVE